MGKRLAILGLGSLLLVAGCSSVENTPGPRGQQTIEEFDVKGTDQTATRFCIGTTEYLSMWGTHKGSLQLVQKNSEECK